MIDSTYVEGAAEDKPHDTAGLFARPRPDCEQLVLALIVNQTGFLQLTSFSMGTVPMSQRSKRSCATGERKHGKARALWIFDRGVVSEENRGHPQARRTVIWWATTRSKLKQFEQELLKDDFEKIVGSRGQADQDSGGEETYILCRTVGRKEKEKAIRSALWRRSKKHSRG